MTTIDTGRGSAAEPPRDLLRPPDADGVVDHGGGRVQEIRIEPEYGIEAYLAILERDRQQIAGSLADLDLPRVAFSRAAGPRPQRQIRILRPVPSGRSGIDWEARYAADETMAHPGRRLRPRWWRRLGNSVLRRLRLRSPAHRRLCELLASYEVIGVWGPPSALLSRALGRLGRVRAFEISRAARPPGLRVAMHGLGSPRPAKGRTLFVVGERSDLDGATPAADAARKFGATDIALVTAGADGRPEEPICVPLPPLPPLPLPSPWPRISVVTVSFQQARFLEPCLRSVLDQGYPNLEYIVIDGGSDDGSREILERYRPRLSTLVIEPDRGQSDALNKGLSRATGDMLTWICSDDCLEPGSLFTVAAARGHTGADVIAGGCRLIDGDGRTTGIHHSGLRTGRTHPLSFGDMASFMGSWQRGVYFFQPELFFSREIWKRAGGHVREDLYYAMDYELFLRFGLAGARVHAVAEVLGCSRRHLDQKTRHELPLYLPTIDRVLQDFAADLAVLAEGARPSGRSPHH
jgi:hypothetical protein